MEREEKQTVRQLTKQEELDYIEWQKEQLMKEQLRKEE
jgi:hypothetical protein